MFLGIMYAFLGVIEAILGLRFIFRLVGANPASQFVELIYNLSTPLVAPFAGIFGQSATVTGEGLVARSIFDWTTLIAMLIYGIIAAIIGAAIRNSRPRVLGV